MPCTYYTPGEELEISHKNNLKLIKQVNELTRLLCGLSHYSLETLAEGPLFEAVPGLREWYIEHEKLDKRQGR